MIVLHDDAPLTPGSFKIHPLLLLLLWYRGMSFLLSSLTLQQRIESHKKQ